MAGSCTLGRRRFATLLLAGTAIVGMSETAALAQQTWQGTGASADFNTAGNWNPNGVPGTAQTAVFKGSSAAATVTVDQVSDIGGLRFETDAQTYSFLISKTLQFSGAGIVNDSGKAQNFVVASDLANSVAFANGASAGNASFTIQRGNIYFGAASSGGTALIDLVGSGTELSVANDNGVNSIGALQGSGRVAFHDHATNLSIGSLDTDTIFSGSIVEANGGTGAITKTGAGKLTLTGISSYSGGTTVDSGTLQIDNGQALGTGTVRLNGGALVGNFTGTLANKILLDGYAPTIAATAGNTLTIGGEIEVVRDFNFGKTGVAGTIVLDPTKSSWTAGTLVRIEGGTLRLGNSDIASKLLGSPVYLYKDAVYDINDQTGAGATLLLAEGTVSTGRNPDTVVTIGAGSLTGGLTGAGSLEIRDVDSNFGGFPLTLGGTGLNTYAGYTRVFSGRTLKGGATNAFNADSATTIDSQAALDLGGFDQEIASLAGAGVITNSESATATLTLGRGNASMTFTGDVKDGTGKIGLAKAGTGTLTLDGANSYTGNTIVNGGTLAFTRQSTLGNVTVNAGTITFGGNGILGNVTINGAGALEAAETLKLDLSGKTLTLSDTATISAATGRTLTLQSDFDFASTVHIGTSDNNGTVSLTRGSFSPASSTSLLSIDHGTLTGDGQTLMNLGNLAGVSIANGATLDLAGSGALVSALTGSGTVTNSSDPTVAQLVVGTGPSGSGSASSTFDGMIEDGAGKTMLIKMGAGTVTLTGNNTHTGGTFAGSGLLQLGNGGATGSIAGNLTIYDKFALNRADSMIFGGIIDGTGELSQIGAGTTQLTGDSSGYTGTTLVTKGTLVVANKLGGSAGVTGGTLQVDGTLGGSVLAIGKGTVTGAGTIAGDVDFANNGGGVLQGQQNGSLTIGGSLKLAGDTEINVALGGPSSAPLFDVQGDLTLAGRLNVTDMGGFGTGIYQMFSYGGMLNYGTLDFGSMPAGVPINGLSIQVLLSSRQVNLISTVGTGLRFWDGGDSRNHNNGTVDGGDGTWRADGSNWTDANAVFNGQLQPNPTYAIFQGAAGTVTVEDDAGAIGVTGMQFLSDGYRIEGDAVALQGAGGESIIRVGNGRSSSAGTTATIASSLTGATRLVKNDYGTLILDGSNAYLGGTEMRAGTLQVARDANLGALAGGLVFTGGTLKTTGTFNTQRGISLAHDGVFDVASNTTLGLTGAVSGSGDLIKRGAGTLSLTGTGNYGNTLVETGTLVGNTGSISGNIGNAATLVFDQAGNGSFAGAITALGATKGTMVKRGTGTLTLTGRSSLDWSVEAGTLVAAAERFGGNVLIGAGGSFGFDQADDASYAGALSGQGHFAKTGAGALKLTGDSSGFAGSTSIANGTLSVDGSLGGVIDVLAGGRLQGKGTIGSLKVAAGSTIAPGNSIGTLNIAGDVALAAGSTYEVEIAGNGTSDRIVATGKATLGGGKVAVTALDAKTSYQEGQTYTILTATGGITGSFDPAVLARSAFLDATLVQKANAVDLKIALKADAPGGKPVFGKVANTDNQKQTATALDTLQQSGAPLALYNTLLVLSADEARAAFDSLSGEVHASTVTGLIEDSRFVRDAVNDRLRSAFETVGGLPLMGYGDDAKEITTASVASERYGAWGSVFGSWGHFGGDGNAARLSRSTGGFVTGVDGLVTDDVRLGFLAGYSHSSFKVDDRRSSASSDNYHLGLYGGTQLGAVSLRSGLAYTWSEIDSSRQVTFPGLTDSLTGSYHAGTTQMFGELGYSLKAGSVAFEPFANLAYVNVHTNGFAEQGGASALSVHSGSNDNTFTTLGLRASTDFDIGSTKATARGMIGWRHAYGDVTPAISQAFTGSSAFTIAGAPIARDAAVIEAGLDFAIAPQATLGLSFQGQFGNRSRDYGFGIDLNARF